jgi:hypothetical protein
LVPPGAPRHLEPLPLHADRLRNTPPVVLLALAY